MRLQVIINLLNARFFIYFGLAVVQVVFFYFLPSWQACINGSLYCLVRGNKDCVAVVIEELDILVQAECIFVKNKEFLMGLQFFIRWQVSVYESAFLNFCCVEIYPAKIIECRIWRFCSGITFLIIIPVIIVGKDAIYTTICRDQRGSEDISVTITCTARDNPLVNLTRCHTWIFYRIRGRKAVLAEKAFVLKLETAFYGNHLFVSITNHFYGITIL